MSKEGLSEKLHIQIEYGEEVRENNLQISIRQNFLKRSKKTPAHWWNARV
jgi:hypothetical protein